MWESTIDRLKSDLDRLLRQIEKYGSDAISGGRAAVIENGLENLDEQIKKLSTILQFCYFRLQTDQIDGDVDPARYVVAHKEGILYFLYNRTSNEGELGHLSLLEKRGFKKEDSLGGGYVMIKLENRDVDLYGSSTSLGPDKVRDLVIEKIQGLLLQQTYPALPGSRKPPHIGS